MKVKAKEPSRFALRHPLLVSAWWLVIGIGNLVLAIACLVATVAAVLDSSELYIPAAYLGASGFLLDAASGSFDQSKLVLDATELGQ